MATDPPHQSIEQYLLKGDSYELEYKGKTGIIFSIALAGFMVDAKAVFDEKENLKALQQILPF